MDAAVLERHGAGAVAQGVIDLMQGHHHGLAVLAVDVGEDFHDPARRLRVERGDGFVGEDHLGLLGQRTGDRHPLLLAAGERRGALRGALGQADALQCGHGLALLLVAEHAQRSAPARHAPEKAEQDVVQHAEAVDQVELLEDVADVGAQAAYLAVQLAGGLHLAAEHLDAPAGGAVAAGQAGQVAQQRGLAGTGRADQRHHLARLYRQAQVEQRLLAGEGLVQSLDSNSRIHVLPSRLRGRGGRPTCLDEKVVMLCCSPAKRP